MRIVIGVCSVCHGEVARETSCDIDDFCIDCGAVRDNYIMKMVAVTKPLSVYEQKADAYSVVAY